MPEQTTDPRCMVDCPKCDGSGKVLCECKHLSIVDGHPLNAIDSSGSHRGRGYTVKICRKCGRVWGLRWQWDSGSGGDYDAKDYGFGDPFELVKERHS